MKKLLLILLGFAIGILVCYFYCCNVSANYGATTTPKGIITSAEASALDKAYDSRHQLISDSIVKRPDNRSSWWSVSDLEGYISHAKNQANTLKYDLNGFRMYLGAHADSGGQVGYTTIFMVPTGDPTSVAGSSGFAPPGNGDIGGADGFNDGGNGQPPSANYPQ